MQANITPIKKKICIILAIFIFFTLATAIILKVRAKTLDLSFIPYNPVDEYLDAQLTFSRPDIATGTIKKLDDRILVHMEPVSPGNTTMVLNLLHKENDTNQDRFYTEINVTHSGLMYSSNYNFNGSHMIFGLYALLFLMLSVCFFIWYREAKRARYFSYKSIQNFGFTVFFFTQSLTLFGILIYSLYIRSEPLMGNHLFTVSSYLLAMISLLIFPLLLIFSILLSISNIGLIRKEGARPANTLGIALSIVLMLGTFTVLILTVKSSTFLAPDLKDQVFNLLRSIFAGIFFYFVSNLFSTLLHCRFAGKHNPKHDKDYVIILGCGIRDDGTLYPLLKGRADRAIRFYREQLEATGKALILVPSGGQGPDECMPEGEAIRNYLISQGIPEEHILPETRSTDTHENMKFSKEIIDQHAGTAGKTDPGIAFSTTNYHVFRSGIHASDAGLNADGMGAKTKWYFWPNALIREYVGLLAHEWKLHLVVCLGVILQTIVTQNLHWIIHIF